MEKLSLILILIGISVFVFSFWGLISIKSHIRQFKNNHKQISQLTDEKYFELKSKQEYVIAISAVIFAIISFIGFTSIDNIKTEMRDKLQIEIHRLDTLNRKANESYNGLELRGKTYEDSVRNAFTVLASLNSRMKLLFAKDVITQNIFIVDPLRVGDFPKEKSSYDEGYHVVLFSSLRTINGKKLPIFKAKPSIICIASSIGSVKIKEIFVDRFIIQLESFLPKNNKDKGDDLTFTAWISQKPDGGFSEDFSSGFK